MIDGKGSFQKICFSNWEYTLYGTSAQRKAIEEVLSLHLEKIL